MRIPTVVKVGGAIAALGAGTTAVWRATRSDSEPGGPRAQRFHENPPIGDDPYNDDPYYDDPYGDYPDYPGYGNSYQSILNSVRSAAPYNWSSYDEETVASSAYYAGVGAYDASRMVSEITWEAPWGWSAGQEAAVAAYALDMRASATRAGDIVDQVEWEAPSSWNSSDEVAVVMAALDSGATSYEAGDMVDEVHSEAPWSWSGYSESTFAAAALRSWASPYQAAQAISDGVDAAGFWSSESQQLDYALWYLGSTGGGWPGGGNPPVGGYSPYFARARGNAGGDAQRNEGSEASTLRAHRPDARTPATRV